jgi:hypothetical protein
MNDSNAKFIAWLEGHERWYARTSDRWAGILMTCKLLALLSSITALAVAAASTDAQFFPIARWLIIGASALAAISSMTLSELKVREMEDLREEGRIEASAILAYARQKLEEYEGDPSRLSQFKDEIRERITSLESSQHRAFVSVDAKQRSKERNEEAIRQSKKR